MLLTTQQQRLPQASCFGNCQMNLTMTTIFSTDNPLLRVSSTSLSALCSYHTRIMLGA